MAATQRPKASLVMSSDERGRGTADRGLGDLVLDRGLLQGALARAGHETDRTAVHPPDPCLQVEGGEVLSDGHLARAERRCQGGRPDETRCTLDDGDDAVLAEGCRERAVEEEVIVRHGHSFVRFRLLSQHFGSR